MGHDEARIREFARSYTDAWCSHDPTRVADHFVTGVTGTNTGPGGTGRAVRIAGFEEWTFGDDGLVAMSRGGYDQDEYDRQLEHGAQDVAAFVPRRRQLEKHSRTLAHGGDHALGCGIAAPPNDRSLL